MAQKEDAIDLESLNSSAKETLLDVGSREELIKKEVRISEDTRLLCHYEREMVGNILDGGDSNPIPEYGTFKCPLTRQIMQEPVMLQTKQTYERNAIELWFKLCDDEGRVPICPVSCSKLTSLELIPNIALKKTISEWSEKNSKQRLSHAIAKLSSDAPIEAKKEAMQLLLRLYAERKFYDADVHEHKLIPLLLGVWRELHDECGPQDDVLVLLYRLSEGNCKHQEAMMDAGIMKVVKRSLEVGSDKQKEVTFKLINELSKSPALCERIGSHKGVLIHLLGLASNKGSVWSSLAEKTLKDLEQVEANIWEMAKNGRIEPLVTLLSEGSEGTRTKVAKYLADEILLDVQKENVTRMGGFLLVKMLSGSLQEKEAALTALLNLSSCKKAIPRMVEAGILSPLLVLIFAVPTANNAAKLKELAVMSLTKIVSIPGVWESAVVDSEGNYLQSEATIHKFLYLLTLIGPNWPNWKVTLLQVLIGISSSPQARECASRYIKSGNGIPTLITFLEDSEADYCLSALNLLAIISVHVGEDVAMVVRTTRKISLLKDILINNKIEQKIVAASILSNIPLTEEEITNVLGRDVMDWCLRGILEFKERSNSSGSRRHQTRLLEGLVGILMHFTMCSDRVILESMKANSLVSVFKDMILPKSYAVINQRVALGLKNLSNKSHQVSPNSISKGFTNLLVCGYRSIPACRLHAYRCDPNTSFCLEAAEAIEPLLTLLEDENYDVQEAAVEALSTLVSDSVRLRAGVEVLDSAGGVKKIFEFFAKLQPCGLQDKTIAIVEKILRVESYAEKNAFNQNLMKALIEAFKHGSPFTKRLAEDALRNANQLASASAGVNQARR